MDKVINFENVKEVYATQELDGHRFIGTEQELTKGDLLLTVYQDDIHFYKVQSLGTSMPTKMLEYNFDVGEEIRNNVLSFRRQKFQELDNSGSFKIKLELENGEVVYDGYHVLRLNKNQLIFVDGKMFQVLANTAKDKKNLTYLVTELNTVPFKMLYTLPVNEGSKLTLVNSYKEYLDNVMKI